MGKNNHDELMAQAEALRADSPRDTIRRVRLDLLDEATGLQRAIASQLRRRGVPTSRERDEADVYFDEDDLMEYTEEQLRYQQFGPSAEELAEDVAKGSIALDDRRIAAVSRLAAKLRAVTIAATRLERLLTVDPKVQNAEYIGCLSEAQSGYVRRDELWTSPAGCFVVRHFFIKGLYGEGWEDGWRIMIFAADDDGTIMSLGRPVGDAPESHEDDGPVSHEVIRKAIDRLKFDDVTDWISGFTNR